MTEPDERPRRRAPGDDPIERFLDELVTAHSTRRPRELRHLLAEVEAHLRDAAAAGVAAGLSQHAAEEEAVRRFGSARTLVAAERRRQAPLRHVVRQFFVSGVFLGGVGAVAVGISGVLAAFIAAVAGSRTLVDVGPGQVLAPSDCARWIALRPGASCRDAAVSDWVSEVVGYRLALGVLGVIALFALALLRRRWLLTQRWTTLPPLVTDTIAVTCFGVAGLWTFLMGLDLAATASGRGSGQWFAAAPVALAAAVVFGIRLVRDIRERPVALA